MGWLAMPLLPLAAAFAAGIALAPFVRPLVAVSVWLLGLGTGILLVALRHPAALARTTRAWAVGPVLLATVALGALRGASALLPPDHVANLSLPRIASLEGRLAAEPSRSAPHRMRLLVDVERVDGEPGSGRVQVTGYGEPPPLTAGQRIAAEVRLYRALGHRNPGGFDYGAYLAREGIHVVGTAPAERIVTLDAPRPPWPARVRRAALGAMEATLPPVSAALLAGLLIGERAGLPPEVDEAFRRAGVYHVLAVSGFNVALLAGTVFTLATLARGGRRAAALAAIAVVIAFALVVGPEPSVIRAALMAVLVLTALLLERDAFVLNSLALAALAVLAVRPGDLADPGFQLSFAATLGIVLAPLPRRLLLGSLGVSLAAQLSVLPITLTHFNQVSTVGILANLVVVPLAGAATVLGLGAVGLVPLSQSIAAVAFDATWPILIALRGAVALAAAVPGVLVHLPAPHWTALIAYTAALLLALAWWRLRSDRPALAARLGAGGLGLMLASLGIAAWPLLRPPDGRLRLTVLDVGQGDAIVLEAPDGRAVLIDAGGGGPMRLDVGERVVAPFLWNRGVLSLAAAVVTHADADHAGGMAAVQRLFRVHEVAAAGTFADGPRWLGGATVSALHPDASSAAGQRTTTRRNDGALVLRLEYGLVSFLLASDIGAPSEAELLARGTPLAATVLKVAHHGSRTSSTAPFLAAVRPTLAVISVGARNPYGHPDPATLARLAATGARVLRTDRDGAVIFETDGRRLDVMRWAERSVERYCLDPETAC